ncbi:zf-HC2 domain-containing protein [Streptomyces sp. NRRL S-1813]|uniref:zf-HC2 domain-containing protein n=1 Tax=Streptomyces sp. NRRL S-1813 TaxID=1463888 RepID=UPI0004C72883|nr:zf-HC2 domain-containing protein [Streptomyces sp. NRRL S-1813]
MSAMGGPSPAEQHLGDRLAALVDGELGHDARERVLAHLATCGRCKAEADAQRRLKSVFAETAPPGPSEGLLARLQQLPGGDPGGPGSRLGNGSFGRGDFARGGGAFRYLPSDSHSGHAMAAVPPQSRARGFRVQETDRPAQRRRFAFAAAGAVSLAAFALGGALPLEAAVDLPGGRVDGGGTAVTPLSVSPAADSNSLLRREEFPAKNFRSGAWQQPSGGPTMAPAPSAMTLYGPTTAPPSPQSSAAATAPAGRFGLSPLIAATGPASAYHLAPLAAATGNAPVRKNPPGLPPLEPMRPLIGSAAAAGPSAPGSTSAHH